MSSSVYSESDDLPVAVRDALDSSLYQTVDTGFFKELYQATGLGWEKEPSRNFTDNSGLSLRLWWRSVDGADSGASLAAESLSRPLVVGTVRFPSRTAEGPPGGAHGGAIAAVLDQVLGFAAWLAGGCCQGGMPTLTLKVSYRKMVQLDTEYTVRAWCERSEGRKFTLRSQIEALPPPHHIAALTRPPPPLAPLAASLAACSLSSSPPATAAALVSLVAPPSPALVAVVLAEGEALFLLMGKPHPMAAYFKWKEARKIAEADKANREPTTTGHAGRLRIIARL